MSELIIKDLHVSIEEKEILKGVSLTIKSNEIHALMGPNGNGKSTLLSAIMGHPKYIVTSGSITLDGIDVLTMSVDERSRAGLFLAMQYPQEVPGVTNSDFLRAAINARRDTPIPLFSFIKEMEKTIKDMEMKPDLAHRFLNEGFSGGEKKRNEIVQMRMLKPSMAMLDEIDSGLDVDALKIVASSVVALQKEIGCGVLAVSHYERFYQLLQPTHAHVLVDGKIVAEGNEELVTKIDTEGYDWLYKEYNIQPVLEVKENKTFTLGTCAAPKKGTQV
ncbi:Fe-S cluster assembly ATPase SufC [Anaerorhabdus sp.]|jgi:Fe-S cluster assembly ATP-binding protein|uniref:Fe-S cluster assembly ATPase SufC n=1 Tax=Anaerorhabdus sp. TaxID=1872524 RepID=UPI002FC69DD1